MGAWKRCTKCKGMVETFVVIRKTGKLDGRTDDHNEARRCLNPRCGHLETVTLNNGSPVATKKGK